MGIKKPTKHKLLAAFCIGIGGLLLPTPLLMTIFGFLWIAIGVSLLLPYITLPIAVKGVSAEEFDKIRKQGGK